MIGISNTDRDKAVKFLRAYATLLQERGTRTASVINARRMALNLAGKLERKPTVPPQSEPGTKPLQPQKRTTLKP